MLYIFFNRVYLQIQAKDLVNTVLIISFIVLFIAALLVFLLVMQKRNHEKHAQEKINMRNTFNQELLQTRLEIQEETFKTISQEIHDNIGQALSFVKLNINTVDVHNPDDTRQKLLESKNQLSKTIQDLRDLAKSLNPDFIGELGLSGAIEQQLQLLQKTGAYKTFISVKGKEVKSQQQDLVIFRIVQELLNNIVKHADATDIDVAIVYNTDGLVIIVKDNGKGFNSADNNAAKSLGLANMRNRMKLINGYININSAAGRGTTVMLELPRTEA